MRKRLVWLGLLAALALAAVLITAFEPTRIVWGWLAREPFFRDRPLGYWREVLRGCGSDGTIPLETYNRFWDGNAAFPVLRECARDPDRNVRWPAIALLSRGNARTRQILDLFVEALEDDDIEVRLKALGGLWRWGPMAREAVPAVAARFQDPEPQVAHFADLVLWEVNPAAAPDVCGWGPHAIEGHGVSVMMPGEVERTDVPMFEGKVVAQTLQGWHRAGDYQAPTRYIVLVTEYPEGFLPEATDADRFKTMRDAAPFFFPNGEIVEEKEVTSGELRGREYVLEVKELGRLRNRVFWAGRKLYGIAAAFKPEFLNAAAADYFLDSFQVTEEKEPQAEGGRSPP